ncbi:MAG: L,D-transpeptidase family protein [Salaquimonas sp.]
MANNLIVIRSPGKNLSNGILRFRNFAWPCLLGKNGITVLKKEGDCKTPAGSYPLLFAFHNKERISYIRSKLPIRAIRADDGWCDDPANANYNRAVTLPFSASHETLLREDHLYDLIVVMDHNYSRRINGRGSAVFFHLIDKKDYTAGCVAVPHKVMQFLLPQITTNTRMIIKP